jgi:hypothetical protein
VTTSLFDLYKVGIGPSSSHTMGPMRAARTFLLALDARGLIASTTEVKAELYGSLALTGVGHGTDRAIVLGLLGEEAATIDPDTIDNRTIIPTVYASQPSTLRARRSSLPHTSPSAVASSSRTGTTLTLPLDRAAPCFPTPSGMRQICSRWPGVTGYALMSS